MGVSAWGCTPPLPWTEFLTHACENFTFPQLRLRTVTNALHDGGPQMLSGARPVITELPKGIHVCIHVLLLSLLVQSASHDSFMVHVHILLHWKYRC